MAPKLYLRESLKKSGKFYIYSLTPLKSGERFLGEICIFSLENIQKCLKSGITPLPPPLLFLRRPLVETKLNKNCDRNAKVDLCVNKGSFQKKQFKKLEAAKAACLVCLSLLSLTGSFLVLLGPSG